MSIKADAARELLAQFPKAYSKQIARMLHDKWPDLFPTLENARSHVRLVRGANGPHHRLQKRQHVAVRTHEESELAKARPFGLPQSEPENYEPATLPANVSRWLVLADTHIPYHDLRALALALQYGRDHQCDGVLLLGDIADCYQLSRWEKDPRSRRFEDEIAALAQFLDALVKALNPTSIVWKAGNHEYRLERYLMNRAPELFGMQAFTYKAFLNLDQRNVQWVGHGIPIFHKQLTILHGDEYRGGVSSPVNPARGIFLKARDCTLVAHGHRTSEHTKQNVRKVTTTCWSQGCLCGLNPAYMPLNQWNHGFAILDTADSWKVHNHRIVNGEVM
jgi:predicted phosphodiesterase